MNATPASCLFCRLVSGELPSRQAFSDDLVYAFYDVNPVAPVHVLVVPRRHIADAGCLGAGDADVLEAMMSAARSIAGQEGVATSGYRLVLNVGEAAGTQVAHLHMHLMGGRRLGWPPG